MQSLPLNRHRSTAFSAKRTLRAQVAQLSPAKQREFLDCALHLIAVRLLMEEVEAQLDPQPHSGRKPTVFN
jgi:hypothetical protein